MSVRTDLALEAREMVQSQAQALDALSGVLAETEHKASLTVTRVKVDEQGSRTLGKPQGEYITVEAPNTLFSDLDLQESVTRCVAEELRHLLGERSGTALVVGLGNRDITADALGPLTVERLLVTRHLKEAMPQLDSMASVCALSPGVLGLTGIETAEIVRGVVERVSPSFVLMIDALAARRMERVNTTVQLSDTGIRPGAGVGNHRLPLDEETLGVPVFSIGVPTVVDAATIASDALESLCRHAPDSFAEFFGKMDEADRHAVLSEVLGGEEQNPFVTPKDMDSRVRRLSVILSEGLSLALQPRLDLSEIRSLTT
ncbi:MAG: GPR endopeptidase [Clostridia bacterium]|nr:GPR endopeptidase [Clostridia bacterium]